ncbi:sigma-70 family RNA polymerase sigma factor [uncultured Microbacterium sp.]|uniref:sigma-70 family RNA polymerase sigma factor n=1 Tax=uncultured Microbacterium sp. TaxID=191216 RepID=UPI002622B7CB|nr:sigma-70 family RNA polymerase sigma factor [uncultured Microbacterium sp.]
MSTLVERNRLIVENLPLVGYLAAETHARATHIPREDLAAVGALALVTAADAFDASLGVPFGAYARRRILGAFADEMRSMDWASRGIRRRIKETIAVSDTLAAALGRAPSVAEIATAMATSEQEVIEALADAARSVSSLDDGHELDLVADMPLPEESAVLAERRAVLEHAVTALPERMQLIIRAVYIEERPVKDIAAELGVSHSAVSQQRSEAVRLLRDAMERYFHENGEPPITSRVSATVRDAFFDRIAATGGDLMARAFGRHAFIS